MICMGRREEETASRRNRLGFPFRLTACSGSSRNSCPCGPTSWSRACRMRTRSHQYLRSTAGHAGSGYRYGLLTVLLRPSTIQRCLPAATQCPRCSRTARKPAGTAAARSRPAPSASFHAQASIRTGSCYCHFRSCRSDARRSAQASCSGSPLMHCPNSHRCRQRLCRPAPAGPDGCTWQRPAATPGCCIARCQGTGWNERHSHSSSKRSNVSCRSRYPGCYRSTNCASWTRHGLN